MLREGGGAGREGEGGRESAMARERREGERGKDRQRDREKERQDREMKESARARTCRFKEIYRAQAHTRKRTNIVFERSLFFGKTLSRTSIHGNIPTRSRAHTHTEGLTGAAMLVLEVVASLENTF